MPLEVHEVTWIVTEAARDDVARIRDTLGEENYSADVRALRRTLCGYFDAVDGCSSKLGASVVPVGASADGGKLIKVRWGVPGCGKSGGLRLAFVAYCDSRRVVLCRAFIRRDDPDDADFESAAKLAEQYAAAGLNGD